MNAGKVKAFGPGLEPKGNVVGQQATFTVETGDAGKGTLDVLVVDPKGKQVKCDSVFNKDKKMTYSCVFVPQVVGDFKVTIKFGGKEIPKSPFVVKVEEIEGDASKVIAQGPGLEQQGIIANTKTYFEVVTKDAGKGAVDIVILDPTGHEIKPTITPSKDGVFVVEYTATKFGQYSISIYFGNKPITHTPYNVFVAPAFDVEAVYATGRGLQPYGVKVKQHAEFKVHTAGAGTADVEIQVTGPGGIYIKCDLVPSRTEEDVYECTYVPPKVGQYLVNITFGGLFIAKSPFCVDVGPAKTSNIVAFGPGLKGGIVNQPARFIVETNGEPGVVGFAVDGPSKATIDCKDNHDGSYDVTYWPTAPGEHAVHVMYDEEDILQSPFMAQIQPATTEFDTSKIIAKGPGLEETGVITNNWAEFMVDARKAGQAPFEITCLDATYMPVNVEVKDNRDGTFSCRYLPKNPIKHTVVITWGPVAIPNSPFRVNVTEPRKLEPVKVYGPGVEKDVKACVKIQFTVECKTVRPGDLAIAVTDEKITTVPINITDNKDGTFTVEYEPKTPGVYTVQVFVSKEEVPVSPIKVKVETNYDISKVTVKGLDKPINLKEKRQITIDTTMAVKKDAPCEVIIVTPSGKTTELTTTKIKEGYSAVFTPTEAGIHTVTIKYANQNVPKSPFSIPVESKEDVIEIKVTGLDIAIPLGETRPISIVTSPTPRTKGLCKVTVTTPGNDVMDLPVKESSDGFTVKFTPTDAGTHVVEVTYNSKPVSTSPFSVNVEPKKQMPEIEVMGLEKPIPIGESRPISVVISPAPKTKMPCKVTVTTPAKKIIELTIKDLPNGYTTTFTPTEAGTYNVDITYGGKPVNKSPFTLVVEPMVTERKQAAPAPKVHVKGLEKPILVGETRTISVVISPTPKKKSPCKVTVSTPEHNIVDLPLKDSTDGYTTTYTPTETGSHKIEVIYEKKPIEMSPFTVMVESVFTETKQTMPLPKVEVKGLEKPIPIGEARPIYITTSSKPKAKAPCKVSVTTPEKKIVELPVKDYPDGYMTTFTPTEAGTHTVEVLYDKKPVDKSPFTVMAEPVTPEPKKPVPQFDVKGLEKAVTPGEKRPVTIVITNAPRKEATCIVTDITPEKASVDLKTKKIDEGYEAVFSSVDIGRHMIKVEYDGKEIPGSPFEIVVEKIDTREVTVTGLDTAIPNGESRKFSIVVKDTDQTSANCRVKVISSKDEASDVPMESKTECYEYVLTPNVPGQHRILIEYAGKEVPGTPFFVNAEAVDISKVVVKGLEPPIVVDENRPISVITPALKEDVPCKVTVKTPKNQVSELPTFRTTNGYGTYFVPAEAGQHALKVECAGQEVPGSPFTVVVEKKSSMFRGLESLLGRK